MSCIIILIGDTITLFMKCMLSTNRSFIYIILPPPPPQHNYVTLHAFSICATALGKRPPPPPSHSASYNITCNHHYHHHHHLDHHSTNYNACIQYMRHCFRKKTDHQCKLLWAWSSTSTLQTTACANEYMRTVEDKDHQCKLQRVKNYTATISVHDAASTCNLHKGMPLNFCPYPQFNGICPYASLSGGCM